MSKKRFHIIATALDKRGRPLSVGYNSYKKTHPVQARFAEMCGLYDKIYLHAEISCLTKLNKVNLVKTLVVERYDNDGNPADARPCKICMAAIKQVGIRNIEYTKTGYDTRVVERVS